MSTLSKKLPKKKKLNPVWRGPIEDGITQSLLNGFIVCRERFRIRTILGFRTADSFRHAIEFGSMWHICEEHHAEGKDWKKPLLEYAKELAGRYRNSQEKIDQWYNVVLIQFPIYVEYWEKHPDVKNRTPLYQEMTFKVEEVLPSGRSVYLRGKWDSVDLVGKSSIYLQENKTKGDIDEERLQRNLNFDLQTGIYLCCLQNWLQHTEYEVPGRLKGVRYNVIRRPLSGGKGSIRQKKPSKSNPRGETNQEFYSRLGEVIREDEDNFFMRWKVNISEEDLARFRKEFLHPILEQLCDWWEWVSSPEGLADPFANPVHWRTPYGIYSPLMEGRSTDLDQYLLNGDTLGLERGENLFPELD